MSTSTSTNMEYKGRKTRRADGHARKQALLEATLRIIQRDGVRAVRHRAVAIEAGVPLAATTYYFKDINELISDAFTLFAERSMAANRELEQAAFNALSHLHGEHETPDARQKLAHLLCDFALNHIRRQIANKESRMIEHAFRFEALRNEKLAQDARIPHNISLSLIRQFFQQLRSADPHADAELVYATLMQSEYQLLLNDGDDLQWELVERSLSRLFDRLLSR